MGSGLQANTALPSVSHRDAPFGAYVEYPEKDELDPEETEECAADRFARRIQWPALLFLTLLEGAWLAVLVYVAYRLV